MIPAWLRNIKRRLFRKPDSDRRIREGFERRHGRVLPLDDPVTFSEKLARRMILLNRNGNPLFSDLADKVRVRDWVAGRIGADHLVTLLWTGQRPEAIPFDDLPSPCIIKPNHGSGGHAVYRHGADRAAIVAQLRTELRKNYFWAFREAQYWSIRPAILVEEFLSDGHADGPLDYRFWCFDGEPALIQVDNNSHSINPFYDTAWNPIDLSTRARFDAVSIDRPRNLDEMLDIARTLSAGFGFVRVDLYSIGDRTLFGEMTFTPVGGAFSFSSAEWDRRLGALWTISD